MARRQRKNDAWRRYIEREQLASTMNATKWRETTEAMRHLVGGPPGFRLKDIQGPGLWPDFWDREWYYHPRPWETIEWLKIQPDPRQYEIMAILRAIGAPFSLEGGHIRIWGWLRPGIAPAFA
jgi:hypothetical protein